jgi:hypothetical protein
MLGLALSGQYESYLSESTDCEVRILDAQFKKARRANDRWCSGVTEESKP